VLVLDERTLKFSLLTLPAPMRGPYRRTSFRVIGSGGVDGEDRARFVRVDAEELEVFGQLPDSGEWVMLKSIGLRARDRGAARRPGLPVVSAAGEDRHCGQHVRGVDAGGEDLALLRGAGDHGGGARAREEPAPRAVVPVRSAMASPSARLRTSRRRCHW